MLNDWPIDIRDFSLALSPCDSNPHSPLHHSIAHGRFHAVCLSDKGSSQSPAAAKLSCTIALSITHGLVTSAEMWTIRVGASAGAAPHAFLMTPPPSCTWNHIDPSSRAAVTARYGRPRRSGRACYGVEGVGVWIRSY